MFFHKMFSNHVFKKMFSKWFYQSKVLIWWFLFCLELYRPDYRKTARPAYDIYDDYYEYYEDEEEQEEKRGELSHYSGIIVLQHFRYKAIQLGRGGVVPQIKIVGELRTWVLLNSKLKILLKSAVDGTNRGNNLHLLLSNRIIFKQSYRIIE